MDRLPLDSRAKIVFSVLRRCDLPHGPDGDVRDDGANVPQEKLVRGDATSALVLSSKTAVS